MSTRRHGRQDTGSAASRIRSSVSDNDGDAIAHLGAFVEPVRRSTSFDGMEPLLGFTPLHNYLLQRGTRSLPRPDSMMGSHASIDRLGYVANGPIPTSPLSYRHPPREFLTPLPRLGGYVAQPVGHLPSCDRDDPHPDTRPPSRGRTQPPDCDNAISQLADVLRAYLPQRPQSPITITFSGEEYQCPRKFIQQMEDEFRTRNTKTAEQTTTVAHQLRGEARTWYRAYETTELTYPDFRTRFLDQFENPSLISRLMSRLYGRKQPETQPVGVFVAQQWALARRLVPQSSEEEVTELIVEGLKEDVKIHMLGKNIHTLEKLTQLANDVERSLKTVQYKEPRKSSWPTPQPRKIPELRKPNPAPRATQPAPRTVPFNNSSPPNPCWSCGGDHWNRDCPKRKPAPPLKAEGTKGPEAKPSNSQTNF